MFPFLLVWQMKWKKRLWKSSLHCSANGTEQGSGKRRPRVRTHLTLRTVHTQEYSLRFKNQQLPGLRRPIDLRTDRSFFSGGFSDWFWHHFIPISLIYHVSLLSSWFHGWTVGVSEWLNWRDVGRALIPVSATVSLTWGEARPCAVGEQKQERNPPAGPGNQRQLQNVRAPCPVFMF